MLSNLRTSPVLHTCSHAHPHTHHVPTCVPAPCLRPRPQALNTRSAEGDTPLGWALKYGAAGLLSGDVLTGDGGVMDWC